MKWTFKTDHKSIWKKFLKIEDIPDWRFTYFFVIFDEMKQQMVCHVKSLLLRQIHTNLDQTETRNLNYWDER